MISIKRFLNSPEPDSTRLRVIVTLLEGISQHSPVGDPVEHERFQSDIQGVLKELGPETESAELLLMAGRIVKTLEEYNRRTLSQMGQQSAEWRTIVEMLAHTIGAISAASGRSAGHLAGMHQELKRTSDIDDVRVLKTKISECLKGIETEIEEQNKETGVTLESLRQQLKNAKTVLASIPVTGVGDPLTGLPARDKAEQALAEACRSSVQTYAVLYVMDRVVLINSRFGTAIGDYALRKFKDFIMADAHPEDLFFRWGGPAFLALVQRTEPIDWMRRAVARTVSEKCEITVETETRSLMLPLSSRWAVFPMFAAPRLLIGKLEAFTAAQGSNQ